MNTTLVTIEMEGKKRCFQLLGVLEEHDVMNALPGLVGPGVFKLLTLEHEQRTLPGGVKDADRMVELDEKGQMTAPVVVEVRLKGKAEMLRHLKVRLHLAALLEKHLNERTVQEMLEQDPDEVMAKVVPWAVGLSLMELEAVLREVLPQPGETYGLSIGCYEYLGMGRAAYGVMCIEETTWRDGAGRMLYSFKGVRGDAILTHMKMLWDGFTWALNEKEAVEQAQAMRVELIGTPVVWRHLHMLELPGLATKHETVLRRERSEA